MSNPIHPKDVPLRDRVLVYTYERYQLLAEEDEAAGAEAIAAALGESVQDVQAAIDALLADGLIGDAEDGRD